MSEPRRAILAVRLDSLGDVLLMGPALRALRNGASRLDLLVSPAGAPAAELLPGIDDVLIFDAPWVGYEPPPVDSPGLLALVERLRERDYDEAVVFTSFHQSPLPMALLARLAGIPRVAGTSEDYAGALLDVRHRRVAGGAADTGGPEGGHEVPAALALVRAAGHELPTGDDLRLRLRPLGRPTGLVLSLPRPYVVVHPTASVPSRSISDGQAADLVDGLVAAGWHVVLTGAVSASADSSQGVSSLATVGHGSVTDARGRTTFAELAQALAGARCVVTVNSGPAHLAAAVGTPVVSLFSPVVPMERWGPWGVPCRVLGDQRAGCRGSRARECPIEGHPCLSGVAADAVVDAVLELAGPVRRQSVASSDDSVVVA
ncbi:MAG TPA: glycosyltransferase family 9 protein [Intrasporangium sp.]|nr:glycosyltransferase family 9 protein [Intrasporangium sp.]